MTDATPMEALTLIARDGPIHHSLFVEVQQRWQRRITKTMLRVLRRRGWIIDNIDYAWCATDAGMRKAEAPA